MEKGCDRDGRLSPARICAAAVLWWCAAWCRGGAALCSCSCPPCVLTCWFCHGWLLLLAVLRSERCLGSPQLSLDLASPLSACRDVGVARSARTGAGRRSCWILPRQRSATRNTTTPPPHTHAAAASEIGRHASSRVQHRKGKRGAEYSVVRE